MSKPKADSIEISPPFPDNAIDCAPFVLEVVDSTAAAAVAVVMRAGVVETEEDVGPVLQKN